MRKGKHICSNCNKCDLPSIKNGYSFIFRHIFCILLTLKYNEYRNYNSPIRVVVSSNAPPSTIVVTEADLIGDFC